jgi:hypothetical protein
MGLLLDLFEDEILNASARWVFLGPNDPIG